MPEDQSDESPLSCLQIAVSPLCPHMVERGEREGEREKGDQREGGRNLCHVSSIIPSLELYLQDLITSSKPHLQIPSHWKLGFQHTNFGVHKHLVHSNHIPKFWIDWCFCFY